MLAFCCAAAAELPYRKADEPLTLLNTINSIVVGDARICECARGNVCECVCVYVCACV